MAEKDSELIIAFFPTVEAADAGAQHLKDWDKERKDIKLGAMSIMAMDENGELQEHEVGARAGGKGAKWGLVAGAVAGILSGGIALIGGALVGGLVGALGGSLFHKDIGMSDEEQATLTQHLKDGGAALAVMMDYDEIESTVSELNKLDAQVATYTVPQEVLDDIARMAKGEEVMRDRIKKDQSVEMAGEEPD